MDEELATCDECGEDKPADMFYDDEAGHICEDCAEEWGLEYDF